jgi:hypothetical protein
MLVDVTLVTGIVRGEQLHSCDILVSMCNMAACFHFPIVCTENCGGTGTARDGTDWYAQFS